MNKVFGKKAEALREVSIFTFLKVFLLIYINGSRKVEARSSFCFSETNSPIYTPSVPSFPYVTLWHVFPHSFKVQFHHIFLKFFSLNKNLMFKLLLKKRKSLKKIIKLYFTGVLKCVSTVNVNNHETEGVINITTSIDTCNPMQIRFRNCDRIQI